jgi:hypothetical protein
MGQKSLFFLHQAWGGALKAGAVAVGARLHRASSGFGW